MQWMLPARWLTVEGELHHPSLRLHFGQENSWLQPSYIFPMSLFLLREATGDCGIIFVPSYSFSLKELFPGVFFLKETLNTAPKQSPVQTVEGSRTARQFLLCHVPTYLGHLASTARPLPPAFHHFLPPGGHHHHHHHHHQLARNTPITPYH